MAAISVQPLSRGSATNIVGLRTKPNRDFDRAGEATFQANVALAFSDTPLVAPVDFTGAKLVVDAAPPGAAMTHVMLVTKVHQGGTFRATRWCVVQADTSAMAPGAPVYASATVDGGLDTAGSVQVGEALGAPALSGFILLAPGQY